MKNLTTRVPNYTHHLPLQYSNFCLSREWASLYSHCYQFQNVNVHAEAFSSPKQTILHRQRNTVNQLQLNYFTNIHLLVRGFMKSLCVIIIKLDFEQRSHVYNTVCYNAFSPIDRVIMESQCGITEYCGLIPFLLFFSCTQILYY